MNVLVGTTSASVAAVNNTIYQWCWVVLALCAWICIEVCLHQLSLRGSETKAAAKAELRALAKCLFHIQMSVKMKQAEHLRQSYFNSLTSTEIEPRLKLLSQELVQHWHDQVLEPLP